MTEAGWGTDLETPAPKRRMVPVWVWACGGGCALLVVVLAIAAWFAAPRVKQWFERMNDPEVQWAELAQVLPFDEPRPEYKLQRVPMPFLQMWALRDGELLGYVLAAPHMPEDAVRQWFDHPEESPALKQSVKGLHSQKGRITVQGRQLECTRFMRENDAAERGGGADSIAVHIAFELTPPVGDSRVLFTLSTNNNTALTDDDVDEFLAPFRVGKDR